MNAPTWRRWIALPAALFITTAGVAFVGPTGDGRCRDGPHPGIAAADHWADDRTVPPVWACRYLTERGVVWRHEQFGALYRAAGVAALLLLLIVAFRRRLPPALQGLVVAWLTVAVYGALASFDVVAAWGATPLVVLPCVAFALWRPLPGFLRWWWAGGIALLAWGATTFSSMHWGETGSPWPGLTLGALLGAAAPRIARTAPDPPVEAR